MFRSKIFLGGMVAATSVSAFVLVSSTTSAASTMPQENRARIEVANACTMESEVSTAHTATVSAGSYKEDIGNTIVSVVCNDNAGFAVYAIGFTNDTDGTTTMNGTLGSTIATGLTKQGNTSSWSMKLSTYDNDPYAPTIENDYDDYNVVPDDYTMVASYPAATTVSEPSVFKTSYAAYASMGQAADTYTGQVKYVMIHPSDGDAPEKEEPVVSPLDPDPDPTKDTVHPCMKIGDLACTDTDDDGEPDSLVFPANSLLRTYEIAYTNAGKPMYIEDANTTIGWRPMVESDYATVGGKEVRFAVQDIAMSLGDTASNKVCSTAASSLPDNSYIDQALVMDVRDGISYYITKAADGRCWMQDNLALDLTNVNVKNAMYSDTDTNHNTNTNATNTQLGYLFNGGRVSGDNLPTAGVANWTSGSSFSDPLTTVSNKDIIPSDALSTPGGWKVGGYYNYCAASAGSYCYGNGTNEGTPVDKPDTDIDAEYDICPSGWRIPTGGASGEYQALANAITGGTSDEIDTEPEYSNIRNALSLPLSGGFYYGSVGGQGSFGGFWSSTYYGSYLMYYLYTGTSDVRPQSSSNRGNGGSVRCIAK